MNSAEWIYNKGYENGYRKGTEKGYEELKRLTLFCLAEGYLTAYDAEGNKVDDEIKAEAIVQNFINDMNLQDGLPER